MCVLSGRERVALQVDMRRVNMDVVKPWITRRVTEILGFEDDVVIEFIFNLFEGNQVWLPPPLFSVFPSLSLSLGPVP